MPDGGNPGGRPRSAKAAIRKALAKREADGTTRLDRWAESIVASADDPRERREILEFLEGRPTGAA